MKNTIFLLYIMFVGVHSECMEQQGLVWTVEAFHTIVVPYLTMQSVGRFARTCELYANVFDPAKVKDYKPCFDAIEQDFYRATHVLSRLALQRNETIFNRLWRYDHEIRNKNIEQLHGKLACNFSGNMNAYCMYYKSPEEVDTRIVDQLRGAITDKDRDLIKLIGHGKKHNVFELFTTDDKIELAFKNLCQLNCGNSDYLVALLPVESGEHKNRAVQYICKYDDMDILCALLKKGYLTVNEEYGHKCTLVHYAALRGLRKLKEMLQERGADLHAINSWAREPLDYIQKFRKEHDDVYQYPYAIFKGIWIDWCKNVCGEKHTGESKEYVLREFGQEELQWLHRSCPYSITDPLITIKKTFT